MALKALKCNHLTPLGLKGLKTIHDRRFTLLSVFEYFDSIQQVMQF